MKRDTASTHPGENPLGYAPIGGLIAKFAIPSVISMVINAAYNITDQVFIGHMVGVLGNAATNVVFPLVVLTTGLAQLGVGTAACFNLSMGAKKEEDAKQYISTGLTLMVVLGILYAAIVLLFKTPVLLLCGATNTVLPYAQQYLGITAIGIPFQIFASSSNHLIRADGSPTYSMVCNLTGAVLNVILDWLFMFVFRWGIRGAAAATVIGQVVAALLCLVYYTRFKTFRIRLRTMGVRAAYALRIFRLGTGAFLNQIMMVLANIVLNNVLREYGGLSIYGSDIALAVAGVVAKLNTLLTALTVGISLACQPIWGFNFGAKKYDRVKQTHRKALTIAMIISVLFFLAFQLFPRQIAGLFGSGDPLYFEFAERYLRIYMMMVCVFGVQPMSVDYFSATGSARQGIALSLARQGLFLVPLLLLLPPWLGLNGVLIAGPVADFLAFALAAFLLRQNFKRLEALPSDNQ